MWHCLHCPVFSCYGIILAWSCGRQTDTGWQHIPLSQSLSETVLKILNNHPAEESNNNKLFQYSGSRRLPCCCLLANKVENMNRGQVWACSAISPLPWRSRLPHSTPTLAVSKHLTDTAGRTSHVELVSRPQQCRHSITSGILNIFLFRLKFVFIKHWSCQPCYIHPKHGHRLPVTWKTCNPFTWSVSEGSLESGGMILSVTLKSLYALVSHLCLTGLPLTRGRNAIFGHVARLPSNIPACHSMLRQVELLVGRPPDPTWQHPPGRPRTKWTDQLRRDNNNVPIATLWRQAIGHGHSRAMLRSEPTTG